MFRRFIFFLRSGLCLGRAPTLPEERGYPSRPVSRARLTFGGKGGVGLCQTPSGALAELLVRRIARTMAVNMGTFSVKFTIKHPAHPEHKLDLEGLVDTGALYTQVPAELIAQIGITTSGVRAVHYADGAKDTVPVAKADIAVNGVETATMVLCGKPNSLVLLGAVTLESLGLGVDPVHKRLIPIESPMATSQISTPLPSRS